VTETPAFWKKIPNTKHEKRNSNKNKNVQMTKTPACNVKQERANRIFKVFVLGILSFDIRILAEYDFPFGHYLSALIRGDGGIVNLL